MFQNIKVDIIYYNTNTDFELEFNLCGCCRMRLLTSKASDKKTLVHDLARAVSRSRVIIIAGALTGEDGIMDITAHSISKTLSDIDTKRYGITPEENIKIINGATPLVTPEGIFGGCIIESGPQSMILLSDNKVIRKSIMNNLIHPYIADLCGTELKATAATVTDNSVFTPEVVSPSIPETKVEELDVEALEEEETVEQAEEITEQEEILQEVEKPSAEETEEAVEAEEIVDTEEASITSGNIIFEVEKEESIIQEEFEDSVIYDNTASDEAADFDNDYEETENSGFFAGNLPILILSIMLLVILAVLCYCIFYIPAKDGISATAYLNETFSTLFG